MGHAIRNASTALCVLVTIGVIVSYLDDLRIAAPCRGVEPGYLAKVGVAVNREHTWSQVSY